MKKLTKQHLVDQDIQVILGTLLRVGVILAMTVVLIGGVMYLMEYSNELVDYNTFKPFDNEYATIAAIFKGLYIMDSKAIIQFGTILLIFTPITRVVFSIFSFLIERDYLYVVIGLIVLSVILFSLSNKLVG
ncbi:DUF1634 domain-containing protein [Pedobacter immunditicola]|uniref:DUF1634 domain-containing protein n=1 Tax=Pedobacter immunditicola TaxID=3133440 RepID=UPI00309D4E3A